MSSELSFTAADLAAFAQASRDTNPLHVDAAYARATAFGEPVVYGALSALRALGHLPVRTGQTVATLSAEFRSPLYVGVSYQVEAENSRERSEIRVLDGRRLVLRIAAEFADDRPNDDAATWPSHGDDEPAEPARLAVADLADGMTLTGRYEPRVSAFRSLVAELDLTARGVTERQATALLACSYLVGMRIPGRNALFYSARLDWRHPPSDRQAGEYSVRIESLHKPLGLVTLRADFAAPLACSAELKSFIRQPIDRPCLDEAAVSRDLLAGKVALVVGASRGLGAALAEALALSGCTVIGTCLQSMDAVSALATMLRDRGAVFEPHRVDATDPQAMADLVKDVTARHGGIDLLVCTACPPLHALSIDGSSLDRILRHVADSVAMVATPLACLLDHLRDRHGTVVLVSSSAVAAPPAEWPHYVAAKRAIEGLAEVAAVSHKAVRMCVVRPPKLLTELVNTPLGRQGATDPGTYAAALVTALVKHGDDAGLGLRIVDTSRSDTR
jgi:NAD(P)-dependent dehydrogenase (short-subunit alcohol dehydrogenase family)/acyl dehydratase